MPANTASVPEPTPSFELKGSTFTLPVLKLLHGGIESLSGQLAQKISEAPEFFRNAPLVIDTQELGGQLTALNLAVLLASLRHNGLIPVGIRGGDGEEIEIASEMGLAILSHGGEKRREIPKQPAQRAHGRGTQFVEHPVRSGQRIYASGADLVVLGPVGSGAEVFADGNIHIYGSLRGRAIAGVNGDEHARILCQGLDAELVSIAGSYQVSEYFDDTVRGKCAQVYLEGRRLVMETL